MKILLTGMNNMQCKFDFYLQQQLQVVPSHYSLMRCLRDMGHDVEQRHVKIGEDISGYDRVIVFVHNPESFCQYVYNGMYAISARPDCILAYDDWQIKSINTRVKKMLKDHIVFKDFILEQQKDIPDDIRKHRGMVTDAVGIIMSKKNKLLLSGFAGGDLSLILDYPKENLFSYNPNPYHLNRQVQGNGFIDIPKERVFNFAGLVQNQTAKWLENLDIASTGWELKLYGSKKDNQERLIEQEMVNKFGDHWGILMARYYHSGSGWWRARPAQCADAGSILIGDPAELFIYYRDEELSSILPMDLVDMTDKQLTDFSQAQKEALYYNHPLNKEVEQEELSRVLD